MPGFAWALSLSFVFESGWERIVASGGGRVEYRLVIEGCEFEFCTTPWMTGDCTESDQDGKRRVAGLVRDGLGFEEQAYLAGAELKVTIPPFRITETPYPDLDAATSVFSAIPNVVAALEETLDHDDLDMEVFADSALDTNSCYHVGRETIRVKSKLLGSVQIERGMWRTTAATHMTTVGAQTTERPIYDAVQSWKHRRWWLYAHTIDELSPSHLGTLVTRGVLSTEPELIDEGTWQIGAESRLTLLEQEVAAGAEVPRYPRGIYYPAERPFWVAVERSTTDARGDGDDGEIAYVSLCGFWETNELFAQAVVEALAADATIATWDITWGWRISTDQRWELMVTISIATPRYIEVFGGSEIDGFFVKGLFLASIASGFRGGAPGGVQRVVGPGSTYVVAWDVSPGAGEAGESAMPADAVRREPRTINARGRPGSSRVIVGSEATFPLHRQYLDDVTGLEIGDRLYMTQADRGTTAIEALGFRALEITDIDTTDGWVEALASSEGPGVVVGGITSAGPSGAVGAGNRLPTFVFTRIYGDIEGCMLSDFRDELVAEAPLHGNDGSTPWVTDDELADWTAPVFIAARLVWQQFRLFAFYTGEKLDEVLREECRLLGLFPYLDSDFKVQLRQLTIPTDPSADLLEITGTSHLTDDGYGRLLSGSDGVINRVEISRGYNPQAQKYAMAPIAIQDIGGVADAGGYKAVLEIRPKSSAARGEISALEAESHSHPARALFSGKIMHVEVDVPLTLWNVLVGDMVLLTIPQLPMAGKRAVHEPGEGMTERRAIVVGRRWSLDEPAGTLTCMIVGVNVGGYTPTGRVASVAGAGTSWVLTLEANRYGPTGSVDASWFAIGDKVRLVPWDSTTTIKDGGTVTAISGNDVSVTFGTAWAGLSGETWNLIYEPADVVPKERLTTFAFVADSTRFVEDEDAELRTAHVFAP